MFAKNKKVKKYYNIYFTNVDYIVLGSGVIFLCLVFIIELNLSYYFETKNLTNIKNIIFSVFTSVIASSIFYFFNILIPRINEINKLVDYLNNILPKIDGFSVIIIEDFLPEINGENVILDFVKLKKECPSEIKDKFFKTFENTLKQKYLNNFLHLQLKSFESILSNYPKVIKKSRSLDLNNLSSLMTSVDIDIFFNEIPNKDIKPVEKEAKKILKQNHFYSVFLSVIYITIVLNEEYTIKNNRLIKFFKWFESNKTLKNTNII